MWDIIQWKSGVKAKFVLVQSSRCLVPAEKSRIVKNIYLHIGIEEFIQQGIILESATALFLEFPDLKYAFFISAFLQVPCQQQRIILVRSQKIAKEDDAAFKLEYVHPYLDGVQNPRNRTFCASCFNSRQMSPIFTSGPDADEVPPVWIDKAGIKGIITELCHVLLGVQNPRNRTFCASFFNSRKMSPIFTGGPDADEVSPVWIDKAGIKGTIAESSLNLGRNGDLLARKNCTE